MAWLTEADVSNYGTDLIDVVQRGALNAVAPHLQNLEQENQQLRHWIGVEARHRMDQEVEKAVPNFREIDADPRWHNWLLSPDPLSGRQRQQLLNESIASGSTHRVINFFKQYENQVAAQASYYGGGTSGRTYTRQQIQQLYEQHRKGHWAGREAEWSRLDADIIRAAAEGRVLNPDRVTK